jgi:hypothetical protein
MPSSFMATCYLPSELCAVVLVAVRQAWAVGEPGMVIHWDGAAWAWVSVPGLDPQARVYAVTARAADDVWATGSDESQGLFVLHWDGTAWRLLPDRFWNVAPSGIAMPYGQDGWIAAGGQSKLLRWDGQHWQLVSEPEELVPGFFAFFTPDDGWGVGGTVTSSLAMHWDGNTWMRVASEPTWKYTGIALLSHTDGWTVGTDYSQQQGYTGYFGHWDGTTWTTFMGPITDTAFYDIAMISTTDGWAVGSITCYACQDHGRIYRWGGKTWSLYTTARRGLFSISAVSADDKGWASAGWYTMLHYTTQPQVRRVLLPALLRLPP